MGTITNILNKLRSNESQRMVINTKDCVLNITATVLDSEGKAMIVGNKYEMYAPAAKTARDGGLGLVWADNKDFTFTYEGVINLNGQCYVGTKDVSFNADKVPAEVYESSVKLTELFGACMLCPVAIAGNVVRAVAT